MTWATTRGERLTAGLWASGWLLGTAAGVTWAAGALPAAVGLAGVGVALLGLGGLRPLGLLLWYGIDTVGKAGTDQKGGG